MSLTLFFSISLLASGGVIRLGMLLATRLGALDHPGGHKQHDSSTPFVGGFGIVAVILGALCAAAVYLDGISLEPLEAMGLGAVVLFITGFLDDLLHLSFKIRFVIQALVAITMVLVGDVQLSSLGELVPGLSANLDWAALPFSIFATVGLINALNMIDGIDGLSGSLSFISLCFSAIVAGLAQNQPYLLFIVVVMGGVAGFLFYNLRYPGNSRARVFLGDNGSMLLGFVFAWLFIALSQGEQRAMPPVTALWIFGVPLLDTVAVMLRRIWLGKSPFHADRNHLHHLFLRAGFRVSDTVWILVLLQIALGAIGVAGAWLAVPDYVMFGLFLLTFAGYFYVICRPWRFVPNLRRANLALGLPSVHARGVFVGYFRKDGAQRMLDKLTRTLGREYDYQLSLHQADRKTPGSANVYALIEINGSLDDVLVGEIRRLMLRIKAQLPTQKGIRVRLFMHRSDDNDRRENDHLTDKEMCNRENERRMTEETPALYSTEMRSHSELPDGIRV